MYLVPIAWIYVVFMMSVAEATNTNGTVVGAVFTFLMYGMAPVALILYFMGTPGRKRAIRAQEAAERSAAIAAHAAAKAVPDASDAPGKDFPGNDMPNNDVPGNSASAAPDASGHAPGDAVAPVGKEP